MKKLKSIWNVRTLFLILAMVPVLALALITLNLILNSQLAIGSLGFRLFSGIFSPSGESNLTAANMNYGLLPAMWGTLVIVLISIGIAFPASLAFAVLANDFSFGFLTPVIRWIMGVLSGIPPIIYAVISSTFYIWFFWEKFGGKGLNAATVPPLPSAANLPSDSSCTLLGGMILALLIIPFITPLLDDVLQNVPKTLKEASLSLGAHRWRTLWSVTLPFALPGIFNALILGVLTALGEAIIVAYAVGLSSLALPEPLLDLLERTAPLAPTVASLAGGGFSRSMMVGPVGQSVASVIGLMLLMIAFVLLGFTFYLQGKIKKRLAQ